MLTSPSISPTLTTFTESKPPADGAFAWPEVEDWDRPPPIPPGPSLCSRIRTKIDSLIDNFQPRPSIYEPTHTRRTYRRAKDKISRFGTQCSLKKFGKWCKEHITPSKASRTDFIDASHEPGPDGSPDPDLSGQAPTPSGFPPVLTRELSFETNPRLDGAPVRTRKGVPLDYGVHDVCGNSQRQTMLAARSQKLSGTTAADSVCTGNTFTTAESIRHRLSEKARLFDARSINSMCAQYHCEADESAETKRVDFERSLDSVNSLDSEKDVYYKDVEGISGISPLPSLPEFNFGFEKPGDWFSQPKTIVV